jgi:hypothetical protein
MRYTPVLSHSIAVKPIAPPPTLVCSSTDGRLDAAWVHVAGELDLMGSSGAPALVSHTLRARQAGRRPVPRRGPAILDGMLTLAGCSGDLDIGEIAQTESNAALLRFSDDEAVL